MSLADWGRSIVVSAGVLSGVALAQPPNSPSWTYDASIRTRFEHADWFGSVTAPSAYSFSHTKLRLGIGYEIENFALHAEGQYFQLYSLPDTSGGPGGGYAGANELENSPGAVALRQLSLSYESGGTDIQVGRFLYANGSEAQPMNKYLATLRSNRISHRLIGPFDFTAGRSFDGGRGSLSQEWGTLFGMFVMPTEGGFHVDQNSTISDISIGALSWTAPYSFRADTRDDLQAFAYFYSDDRHALKVDNRPIEERTGDLDEIEIGTVGAHWTRILFEGNAQVASLLWGGGQFGKWGTDDHRAWAFTAELSAREESSATKPAVRLGYTMSSGDDDPSDGDHHTFFQMVPTVRAFAATPFYNMQNTSELFAQFSARPIDSVTVRTGAHWIQLTESRDLLYFGGGANERRDRFGYGGVPSGGGVEVGTLLDIESTWSIHTHLSATLYYGHLIGGEVVENVSGLADEDIDYLFVEFTLKL